MVGQKKRYRVRYISLSIIEFRNRLNRFSISKFSAFVPESSTKCHFPKTQNYEFCTKTLDKLAVEQVATCS